MFFVASTASKMANVNEAAVEKNWNLVQVARAAQLAKRPFGTDVRRTVLYPVASSFARTGAASKHPTLRVVSMW